MVKNWNRKVKVGTQRKSAKKYCVYIGNHTRKWCFIRDIVTIENRNVGKYLAYYNMFLVFPEINIMNHQPSVRVLAIEFLNFCQTFCIWLFLDVQKKKTTKTLICMYPTLYWHITPIDFHGKIYILNEKEISHLHVSYFIY